MFKEGSEPDIYRDNLAEELQNTPKEERGDILEQAKETPEYQIARNKKIEGSQNEEKIDNGLGVFIKHKTLYHGSGVRGIKKFKESGDVTVGEGIYLTSKAKDAIGYSHERSGREIDSIVYEANVENIKLLDLRNDGNVKKIMEGYKSVLEDERKRVLVLMHDPEKVKEYPYWYPSGRWDDVKKALSCITNGKASISTIQDITAHMGDLFTSHVKSLGYDGLITIEGGEGNHKGNHDSYVIFDPEKVKIIKEQKIKKEK